jgi:hypothetical protein
MIFPVRRPVRGLPGRAPRAKLASMRSTSPAPQPVPRAEPVAFSRGELTRILSVYGYFVAAGEWRDYAIDCLTDAAVFSIFRRASEMPLYRIEKRPALAKKQGAWVVVSMTGAVLKRGHDLSQVLKVFDRHKLKLAT